MTSARVAAPKELDPPTLEAEYAKVEDDVDETVLWTMNTFAFTRVAVLEAHAVPPTVDAASAPRAAAAA